MYESGGGYLVAVRSNSARKRQQQRLVGIFQRCRCALALELKQAVVTVEVISMKRSLLRGRD